MVCQNDFLTTYNINWWQEVSGHPTKNTGGGGMKGYNEKGGNYICAN